MPEQIPFTRGVPSADLLPVDDLRAAAVTAFDADPAAVLSYAPAGYPPLRRWIAERHRTADGRSVVDDPDDRHAALLSDGALGREHHRRRGA